MRSTLQIVGDSKFGGATYLIINWCKYLLANGWDVSVLTTDQDTISALATIPGLKIIDSILVPREIKPLQDMKAFFQLIRFLKEKRFDVVHTYTSTPGFLGRIASRIAGVPAIFHHQAGWPVTDFSSLLAKIIYIPLEYLAVLASTRSICVSHATRKEAERNHFAPALKLATICNGIDASPFTAPDAALAAQSLREQLGIPRDHTIIGSTGRLADQKDYRTFLQACRKLKDSLPDLKVSVVIAGDGPDRTGLEQFSADLGLHGMVRFLGFVRNIPSILALLDMYVTASLWEGLSISIMEAMASARPIVATAIMPNAELIEHEVTGLLVPPRAPEQLAQAMARFLRDPGLARQCAAEAQRRVLRDYTIERMFRETMDLYHQFLPGEQSGRAA